MKSRWYRSSIVLVTALFFILPAYTAGWESSGKEIHMEDAGSSRDMEIPVVFHFDPSGIEISGIDGYLMIRKEGMTTTLGEGEPMVPMDIFSYVIHPYGSDMELEIIDTISQLVKIPGDVAGIPEYSPISMEANVHIGAPTVDIVRPAELLSDGFIRGYHLQDIRFTPILPEGENTVRIYTTVNCVMSYSIPENVDMESKFTRPTSAFKAYLRNMVRNPYDLEIFNARPYSLTSSPLEREDVQYVMITDTEKVGEHLQDLADWKNSKGVPTRIVEMSFIKSNYSGRDTQEKVRNFIKDAVATWETEFVLLGGDISVVPYRSTYVYANGYESTDCAADLYYSDLDGSFNADNDSRWGETTDNVDLRPDVFVGRATAETPAQMETFVAKTMRYEIEPLSGYLDNVTLA
ncbi:MAG: C25 family cysteine peptidase, partial [Candidatus Thermoplasmatota archaeon]|nr:C25 family cysteine peptidase [Candidatus Thermoplasmatota archaeon]